MILLPYKTDIYKEDAKGKEKLVKRGVLRYAELEPEYIRDITEYIDDKGQIALNKCIIYHETLGQRVFDLPVDEARRLRSIVSPFTIIGFKQQIKKEVKTIKQNVRKTKTTRKRVSK